MDNIKLYIQKLEVLEAKVLSLETEMKRLLPSTVIEESVSNPEDLTILEYLDKSELWNAMHMSSMTFYIRNLVYIYKKDLEYLQGKLAHTKWVVREAFPGRRECVSAYFIDLGFSKPIPLRHLTVETVQDLISLYPMTEDDVKVHKWLDEVFEMYFRKEGIEC